jgi:hypothetical protein
VILSGFSMLLICRMTWEDDDDDDDDVDVRNMTIKRIYIPYHLWNDYKSCFKTTQRQTMLDLNALGVFTWLSHPLRYIWRIWSL